MAQLLAGRYNFRSTAMGHLYTGDAAGAQYRHTICMANRAEVFSLAGCIADALQSVA